MRPQFFRADAQVAVAQASLDRAQTETRRTELDLSRFKQLREAGAISQQQLDNAAAGRQLASVQRLCLPALPLSAIPGGWPTTLARV